MESLRTLKAITFLESLGSRKSADLLRRDERDLRQVMEVILYETTASNVTLLASSLRDPLILVEAILIASEYRNPGRYDGSTFPSLERLLDSKSTRVIQKRYRASWIDLAILKLVEAENFGALQQLWDRGMKFLTVSQLEPVKLALRQRELDHRSRISMAA